MTLVYAPRLYNHAATPSPTWLILPKPIYSLPHTHGWKWETHEFQKKAGGKSYDGTQQPLSLVLTGAVSKQDSTIIDPDGAMFDVLKAMIAFLDACPPDGFEFFEYYDLGTTTYRKWKKCKPVGLTYDSGDQEAKLFPYSLTLRADDPAIYTTAPGA